MSDENKNPENEQPKEQPENTDPYIKSQKENIKQEQQYIDNYNETLKWFEENEEVKKFSELYNSISWGSFPKHYASRKAQWKRIGDFYLKRDQDRKLRYYNKAFKCLWEIQQKKLFNKQCLWRAEKIEIPEISICEEFQFWERHIKSCPFLEPVSEEEFHLYKGYLLSEDYETDRMWSWHSWQDYREYKREVENDDDTISYPEWYFYYDGRMGTSVLLTLPDIRGDKEEKYMDVWRKSLPKPPPVDESKIDRRPAYSYYKGDALEKFVKEFDPEMLKYCRVMEKRDWIHDDMEIEEAIDYLGDVSEQVPIDGGMHWRDQVVKVYHEHFKMKVGEEFESAYNDYLSQLQMGFNFEDEEERKKDTWLDHVNWFKNNILEARRILGEPEDLNF